MVMVMVVMVPFPPDGPQNTKTRHRGIVDSHGLSHSDLPPPHRPPLHRAHHHVRRLQDHLAKNEKSE